MAYSAKARLVHELSRNRTSSPHADDYATAASAGSFDMNNDQIINSTVNMGNNTTQQPPPSRHNAHRYEPYENGSEGSADMSIEIGRGSKRTARDANADVSSNLVFSLGNDSQYEVTATPPIQARAASRKGDGMLQRNASLRQANEAVKSNDLPKRTASGPGRRTLSETLAKLNFDNESSFVADGRAQHVATVNTRNTRFARSRQVSANEPSRPSRFNADKAQDGTPRRQAVNNPTVQSATYTANSFLLPNLPNIAELVSGVRKDGTPLINRQSKSSSRFTVSNRTVGTQQYAPLDAVPIPEEEKAIYSSLQLLRDKVAELEMATSEAQMRAEEYETEIIDLKSQLQVAQRRPDSALGSDEEGSAQDKWRKEKASLHASIKALQDRLDRSERKTSVSEIAVKRVTKERDEMVTQLGVAFYNNKELIAENDDLKEEVISLRAELQEFKDKPEKRHENLDGLRDTTREIWNVQGRSPERQERVLRSRKEGRTTRQEERQPRRKSVGQTEAQLQDHMAGRIVKEVQKQKEDANSRARREQTRDRPQLQNAQRSRSRSAYRRQSEEGERRAAASKRTVSAPVQSDNSDTESTTELHITQKTRDSLKNMHLPSPAKDKQREEESRDITYLSFLDPNEVANLRKKLEEELRAKRKVRDVSASTHVEQDDTVRSDIRRRSSLKDLTAGLQDVTGRSAIRGTDDAVGKSTKTVRVQSPHTSDASLLPQQNNTATGISVSSNTSRRRIRAASAEGMTSAFILPDITLRGNQPGLSAAGANCVEHDAASCTACHPRGAKIDIPSPVPVTDREAPQDVDITSGTIRPSQSPPLALATVLKQLDDEITHLKLQLQSQQQLYSQHDPALSKRKRVLVKSRIDRLISEIEKRSDQVYALYDVLEGQKQAAADIEDDGKGPKQMSEEEVEETLMSIGIDPAELSRRVGRKAPIGLDGANDVTESVDLPWDGLSDYESEEEKDAKRRSAGF